MRLDNAQYTAFANVLLSASGQDLLAALEAEYLATCKQLLRAGAAEVAVLQGRAQVLEELVEAFNRAPEIRRSTRP